MGACVSRKITKQFCPAVHKQSVLQNHWQPYSYLCTLLQHITLYLEIHMEITFFSLMQFIQHSVTKNVNNQSKVKVVCRQQRPCNTDAFFNNPFRYIKNIELFKLHTIITIINYAKLLKVQTWVDEGLSAGYQQLSRILTDSHKQYC